MQSNVAVAVAIALAVGGPEPGHATTHRVECGRTGNCTEAPHSAAPSDNHAVRCCSIAVGAGWHRNPGCAVWTFEPTCDRSKTWFEATHICAQALPGARLCTVAELQSDCTVAAGGCNFDSQLIWAKNGQHDCSEWVGSAGTVREIRLGFLGPYNSPVDETANVNVLPAGFLAAVEWLNANISNLLPASGGCGANVTVVPFMLDSSNIGNNSKTRAVQHANQLYKCPDAGGGDESCSAEASIGRNVDAIIADQYSSTAISIAMMAEIHKKPMVGYGTTSDALSNKHDYPYYNRVIAPDRYQAPYLAAMVHSFGWRHIGVLNGHGSYAAGFAGAFAAKCATFEDPILIEERHVFAEGDRDSATMDALLATIEAAGVKIIMLASAGYVDTIFVLERANALGMTGDGYIWIGADGWLSIDDFKDIQGSDGRTEANHLKEYTHGSVGIFHYTDTPNPTAAVGTSARMASIAEDCMFGAAGTLAWQTEAAVQDPSWRIPDYTAPYAVLGLYVWDAVVHTARAAVLADENCFRNGTCLQAAIRNHITIGTTGTVKLNRTTGDRAVGAYVILNIRKDDPKILVPVGSINAGVVDMWGVDSIVWPNGATGLAGIPSDGDWGSSTSKTVTDTDLEVGLTLATTVVVLALLLTFAYNRHLHHTRKHGAFDFQAKINELDFKPMQLVDGAEGPGEYIIPEELPRASVVLVSELGSGQFGDVHKGMFKPPTSRTLSSGTVTTISRTSSLNYRTFEYAVAVKSLKIPEGIEDGGADAQDSFIREAAITAQFDHPGIVGLIGVVTHGDPCLMVLQLCEKGALDSLVKKEEIPTEQLLTWSAEVCAGMAYLSSRSFVHRDLAARNVLVDARPAAKVADFGMSRDINSYSHYNASDPNTRLPIRWLSPETFMKQTFSESSDCWAFGVTLIEAFTRGATPYTGWSNLFVCEKLVDGYHLPRPTGAPEALYTRIIEPCFALEPQDRPSFAELNRRFDDMFQHEASDGTRDAGKSAAGGSDGGNDHFYVNQQSGSTPPPNETSDTGSPASATNALSGGFQGTPSAEVQATPADPRYLVPVPVTIHVDAAAVIPVAAAAPYMTPTRVSFATPPAPVDNVELPAPPVDDIDFPLAPGVTFLTAKRAAAEVGPKHSAPPRVCPPSDSPEDSPSPKRPNQPAWTAGRGTRVAPQQTEGTSDTRI